MNTDPRIQALHTASLNANVIYVTRNGEATRNHYKAAAIARFERKAVTLPIIPVKGWTNGTPSAAQVAI